MPTVRANGIDIFYEDLAPAREEGSGGRIPLVLTHGFAGPSEHWKPEVLPLAEKRTVVLYDVRGHGRTSVPSDPGAYSIPIFAADLGALLKAIGVERAHIGGVSMGGMISAQFAVDYPETCASVLLCDTTCGNAPAALSGSGESEHAAGAWERQIFNGINALSSFVRSVGLETTLAREWEFKRATDPHIDITPYSYEDDCERIKLMTVEGYIGAAHAIGTRPDLTERVDKIAAPTLLMAGEWDGFLPCALRDHELIAGSRLVLRKRCAHGSRWRLDTFLSEIEAFLEDVEAGRPVAGERVV